MRIWKQILCFLPKQINPGFQDSRISWISWIKGTKESTPGVDSKEPKNPLWEWIQRNPRIYSGSGFFSSFEALWFGWSWIDLLSSEMQNLSDSFSFWESTVLSIRAGNWPKQPATGQSLAGNFHLTLLLILERNLK